MAADPTDDPSVADEDLLCRRLNPKWIVPDSTVGERVSSQAFQNHPGTNKAISEFPKGRKYLISLSFRGKASVRPAQVGGFDVNIVIHGSTAVRGRGDLVAYRWALWKLTAPWTHRTRPPHLGKRCAFSTSSTGPFPSNHSRKTPKGPKIALGNPDRPTNNMSVFVKKDHEDPMAEVPPSHGLTEFAAGVPRRFDQKIVRDTEDGQHRSHAHVVGNKSKALKRELARVTTAAGWQMAPPLEH